MRRSDREITDFSEIIRVMEQCDVCRLAMHDEYPYILPLNFGMEVEGRQITLYFHSAKAGKKFELLVRDDRVGFEMDRGTNWLWTSRTETAPWAMRALWGAAVWRLWRARKSKRDWSF